MEFLDKFGMQQSKDALGNVMEEIKVCYLYLQTMNSDNNNKLLCILDLMI